MENYFSLLALLLDHKTVLMENSSIGRNSNISVWQQERVKCCIIKDLVEYNNFTDTELKNHYNWYSLYQSYRHSMLRYQTAEVVLSLTAELQTAGQTI